MIIVYLSSTLFQVLILNSKSLIIAWNAEFSKWSRPSYCHCWMWLIHMRLSPILSTKSLARQPSCCHYSSAIRVVTRWIEFHYLHYKPSYIECEAHHSTMSHCALSIGRCHLPLMLWGNRHWVWTLVTTRYLIILFTLAQHGRHGLSGINLTAQQQRLDQTEYTL